jgi:hypothetical protein
MVEALRISAAVATPLGLLGLIAALSYYFYARRLRFEERRLESLPLEERARVADERLSRYGIDGSNLTREEKSRLILTEMEKRHAFARLCTLVLAVVFVICFAIASYSFVYAMQHTSDLHDLQTRLKEQQAEMSKIGDALLAALDRLPAPERREMVVSLHNAVAPASDADDVLSDPSLTEEDKLTLLTMMTTKAIDRQIEEQVRLINSAVDSATVDVETMKLKRMIDKRSQLFEAMRAQIDGHNQKAKAIIDSMER